ncbi:MAG: winged helix-turn-helix domain-containing protein [Candidatus Dadabacteria bacterium]|nr:winged helix-turn-helix domain-containing protein [Candidatus Dadabacteria bacterium]
MPKITHVSDHLNLSEIKYQLRRAPDADKRMRWQIIYTVTADPRRGSDIALQLGCSSILVSQAVSEYNKLGQESFKGPGSGSNRSHSHMDEAAESKFLSQFINRAQRGLVCTTTEIKLSFEKKIGKEVHPSIITRMLARRGWRKLDPRPSHPKGSKHKQETFKKSFPYWYPQQ